MKNQDAAERLGGTDSRTIDLWREYEKQKAELLGLSPDEYGLAVRELEERLEI